MNPSHLSPSSTRTSGASIGLAVRRLISLCILATALLLPRFAHAAPPPVPVAFPTNITGTAGKLLFRQVGLGRTGAIAYHNGDIFTINVGGSPGRQWRFSNPSDPTSLTLINGNIGNWGDHGTHGYFQVGDWLGGGVMLSIKRTGLGVNSLSSPMPGFSGSGAPNLASFGLGTTDGKGYIYWPFITPFNWIQYAATDGNGFIFRGQNTLLKSWPALSQDGVTGSSLLLGNLLFITSDETDLGLLSYDISPTFTGGAPILLDRLEGSLGSYIAAPYQNYILFSDSSRSTMELIDYSDPANLRFVTSINLAGTPGTQTGPSVNYMQFQDNYCFNMSCKVNMDTLGVELQLDEVGNNRPSGSVAGTLDASQFHLPLGNLLLTGAYSQSGADGLGVWIHSSTPDTRAPYVGYHIPRSGQVNYPINAPISLLIHETLESYTIISGDTVILRPVGGSAVPCTMTFAYNDILTITPDSPLTANTTYEVVVVAGGIKDAAGNGIEGYSFSFSTGSTVGGGNQGPNLSAFSATPSPANLGQTVTLSATATDPDSDPLEYRFTFGNGAVREWAASSSATTTYATAGHYNVKVQVRDMRSGVPGATVSRTATVTAANAISGPLPTTSSPIAINTSTRRVWVVNPDSDSISVLNADTKAFVAEYALETILGLSTSVDPRSVAIDASGNIWVACYDADRLAVLSPAGALVQAINTGYGSAPIGVAMSPDGATAFVTLEGGDQASSGNGQLVRYQTSTRTETGRLTLGPTPRAIAVSSNGNRVLVTRFISHRDFGEVWDVNSQTMTLTRTIRAFFDRSNDGSSSGRGVPNYLSSITISPDGLWAYYTAIKANTTRGNFFNLGTGSNGPLDPDNTLRSIVGRINLTSNDEPNIASAPQNERVDIDNSDSPTSLTFSPRGDWFFVTLQGNNIVAVFDDPLIRQAPLDPPAKNSKGRFTVGLAPQGSVLDPVTNRLFVMNFMGRAVSVLELANFFASGDRETSHVSISSTTRDKLSATVKLGKQIFYQAADASGDSTLPTMSHEGYLSCASCHIDGAHDGQVWDFTQRGEGLRNTTDLRGRAGMVHGNVHWSGNFNEIQDFVLDVVNEFGGGEGLLPAGQTPHAPLGTANAGRSANLDALAAYVASLAKSSLPRSPYRTSSGAMTTAALSGESVFTSQGCATCHSLPNYTESAVGLGTLRNVGTLRTSSGQRLGTTLTGIDTPTLLGLWNTAPYFHDGSAFTLDEVFRVAGGLVLQVESATLVGTSASSATDTAINQNGRVHGLHVQLKSGQSITFQNVDGGSGGQGDLELRFKPNTGATPSGQRFRFRVNGTTDYFGTIFQPYGVSGGNVVWGRMRIENVTLAAGPNNTIEITSEWSSNCFLDDLTVTTADYRAAADPHRKVLNLPQTDRDNLTAYLLQLDTSSAPAGGGGSTTGGSSTAGATTGGSTTGGTTTGFPAGVQLPTVPTYDSSASGEGAANRVDFNATGAALNDTALTSVVGFSNLVAAESAAGRGGVADLESYAGNGNVGATNHVAVFASGAKALPIYGGFRATTFGTDTAISGANSAVARNAALNADVNTLDLTFGPIYGGATGEAVVHFGITVLGRNNSADVTATAYFNDQTTSVLSRTVGSGTGQDTFFGFSAPTGKSIQRVVVTGSNAKTFDDIGFVTAVVASTSPITVRARTYAGTGAIVELRIDNTTVQTWTLTSTMTDYVYSNVPNGTRNVKVHFQDNASTDAEVESVTVGSTTVTGASRPTNTAVWQGQCGGSYSALMHCQGHIDFGNLTFGSGPSGPDLVITDLSWSPANPTVGQAVTFAAVVQNQGNVAVGSGTWLGMTFSVDSSNVTWAGDTAGLASGASRTLYATSTWTATSGSHTIGGLIDDQNQITETNESNNTRSESLAVP